MPALMIMQGTTNIDSPILGGALLVVGLLGIGIMVINVLFNAKR